MRKFSASGRGLAQEFLEVQPINGLHRDVESQSTGRLNGTGPDHAYAPRVTRPEALAPIIYVSRAVGEIVNKIERSRDSSEPMLITGETGTGKDLIARAVQALSARSEWKFIPFDCGAVPSELIVSELFGYRKSAFTGADRDHIGVIREADGATLFLDEIGELPLAAQATFLRCLEKGEVRPLGATIPIKVNVRVIAATNRNLEAEVRAGRFRADLFHRLNKLRLRIPPLRERREDIPLLIEHFLRRHTLEAGKEGVGLSDETRALMVGHQWSGNVRELENVLYRLVAFAGNGELIGPERFLEEIGDHAPPPTSAIVGDKFLIDANLTHYERMREMERLSIIKDLNEAGGNITQAAERLGMCRNGLKNKIKRFGIEIKNHG